MSENHVILSCDDSPTRVTCDATNAAGDDGCYETRKQIKASVRSDLPRNFGTERKYGEYGKIKQEEANRIHTCEEFEMMQQ